MENQTPKASKELVEKSNELMKLLIGLSYSESVFVINYVSQQLGTVAIICEANHPSSQFHQ